MITPLDIQNKEFKRTIGGYNTKAVDGFLDEIIGDYESIYKENIELKDKISMLMDQVNHFKSLEETLKSTLLVAQSTADEVTSSARRKSNVIIEEAETEAKKIIENAKEEVRSIKKEYDLLKKEIFIFKTRYKSFIQAQLASIDEFYEDIEKTSSSSRSSQNSGLVDDKNLEDVENLGA